MKLFIAATLAATAMAAKQINFANVDNDEQTIGSSDASAVDTEPVDSVVPVAPASGDNKIDDMWSNDKIKEFVSKNHGGYEWEAFEKNQLLTEQSRQAFTTEVITDLVQTWTSGLTRLPNVCEPGKECRRKVNE